MKNKSSQNTALLIALIATLLAVAAHAYLTQHFYALKYGAETSNSICNVNDIFNCTAVTASKFSSLFGIPIALWGLATNFVLLYFVTVTRYNLVQDRDKASRYTLLLSGGTVLASIVMGLISSQMQTFCLFCIAAYVFSLIGFIGVYLGTSKFSFRDILDDIKDIFVTERWVAGFLIAIPIITFTANVMYLESKGFAEIGKMTKEKIAYWNVAPIKIFDASEGLILQKGSTEPVMTIVEFADFRCPHCKYAAPALHAFADRHPDVRFVFKPFPLDGTCNEVIKGGDGISCKIAATVMCAEKLAKKGWDAHDYFFEKQEEVIRTINIDKNLAELSERTSLSLNALDECIASEDTKTQIKKMAKEGADAQIPGTPTVFVNGRLLGNGQMTPVLEAAYQTLK